VELENKKSRLTPMKIQKYKSAAIVASLIGCLLLATDHAFNGITPSPSLHLHIDADNTTQTTSYPDTASGDLGAGEMTAQNSTDIYNHPGAYVYANNDYIVDQNVVGYAAGIDKFGNGIIGACKNFKRLLIAASPIGQSANERFVFQYSASDPDLMTHTSNGPYVLPDNNGLRIWTKDGDEVRDPRSAHLSGGRFIAPNHAYSPTELGWTSGSSYIRLYVEAVVETLASYPISVTFYPDGTSNPGCAVTDQVRVMPVYLNRLKGSGEE